MTHQFDEVTQVVKHKQHIVCYVTKTELLFSINQTDNELENS